MTCRRRLPILVAAALTLALALPPDADAGGLAFLEYHPSMGNDPLSDVEGFALAPDGTTLYTAGGSADQVGVYTRNTTTGALTFLEAHVDGAGGVDGLRFNFGVAVSPDGRCVYATGRQDGAVATFDRNVLTGALTFLAPAEAVDNAFAVVVSPDDLHVYVSGVGMANVGTVEVFERSPPPLSFCNLDFVEEELGGVDGFGKGEPHAMAMSADGAHLYVSGNFLDGDVRGAVVVLSRNAGTGHLDFVEREYDGANGVEHMDRVRDVVTSPDGKNVYVASTDNAIVAFSRDAGTGELTFLEVQRDGGGIDGLKGVFTLAVSPDGAYLYASATDDASVAVFRRDTTTGALRFLEVHRDPLIDPPNLVLPSGRAVGVSPLGDTVYVGGKGATVFAVDVCGNGTRGSDEDCDDGNVAGGDGCSAACRLELCGPLPAAGCRGTAPLASQLQLKHGTPDTKDQLQLKWSQGEATLLADFGDPLTTASYLVCMYDASANPQPLLAAAAPAGGLCKKGKPCWKAASTSYKYNDGVFTPGGIQLLQLKEGLVDGKAKIQVKARGVNLLLPTLPLTPPVTVQIHNTETSVCWDAVFAAPDTNQADKLKAKGD